MQELEKILEEIGDIYVDDIAGWGVECNLKERANLPCDNCYECIKEVCKNIIRKHMNDGWIPTKERMPTKEECERDNIRFLISVGVDCCYSTEVARCTWVEANNIDGTDGSYSEFWINQFPHIYRPSHRLIAAWKILELPEPYIPRKER